MKNLIALVLVTTIITACVPINSVNLGKSLTPTTFAPLMSEFDNPSMGINFDYPSDMEIEKTNLVGEDAVVTDFYNFVNKDSLIHFLNIYRTDGNKLNPEIYPVTHSDYQSYLFEEIKAFERMEDQENLENFQNAIKNAKFFTTSNYEGIEIKTEIKDSGYSMYIGSGMVITESRTVFLYYLSVYSKFENKEDQLKNKDLIWEKIISSVELDF